MPAAPAAVPAPVSALQRLEAFEEKLFGPTVVRIGGKIEQGLGSLFSRLPFVHRAHYAELTALAQVEADYEKARTAFDEAAAKLKAAQAAAASTEAASNAEGQ